MKMRNLLSEMKLEQVDYPEMISDLKIIYDEFGGPAGIGNGSKFNKFDVIKRLSKNFPPKNPKVAYRAMTFSKETQFDENMISKWVSGIRSWSKSKAGAMYYSWSHHYSPLRIFFVYESPQILIDGDMLNKKAKLLNVDEPLDYGEVMIDGTGLKMIDHKIDYSKDVPLYIVNVR